MCALSLFSNTSSAMGPDLSKTTTFINNAIVCKKVTIVLSLLTVKVGICSQLRLSINSNSFLNGFVAEHVVLS